MKVKLKLEMIIYIYIRVYILRMVDKADRPKCVPPPKAPKVSVMNCKSICFHGVETLCLVDGILNANEYIDIRDNN